MTRVKSSTKGAPETRRERIVAHWRRLRRPAVGADELKAIQKKLGQHPGEHDGDSPAAIARVLADEGAVLRHPEVIECDAQWREQQINQPPQSDSPVLLTFEGVEELINGWRSARNDETSIQVTREAAIAARKRAEVLARRKSLDEAERAEQLEIAEWLGVWIKTPNLFADWLELRKRSREFRQKFEKSVPPA